MRLKGNGVWNRFREMKRGGLELDRQPAAVTLKRIGGRRRNLVLAFEFLGLTLLRM